MRELFEAYVTGNEANVILVIGASAPAPETQDALEKTFKALGYGRDACTYARISTNENADASANPNQPADDVLLDPQALFLLVEGLDPVCLVVCDDRAREALCATYRASFAADAPARIFGRPAAVFANLDALITTDNGKQKAWSILKLLPHRV